MSGSIRELDASRPGFEAELERLLSRAAIPAADVEDTVRAIIDDVRRRGDEALLEYTARFDGLEAASVAELEVPARRLAQALASLDAGPREALEIAAARIRRFHEHQRERSWEFREDDGTVLGQRVLPLDRAGLYAPGGKAAYPSSVLMTALPARVAGVGEIVLVVPAPQGEQNEMVLAAAHLAGVDRVFSIGGAQAVAALTFGTATVPAVDKIVGPGNQYVAAAKRQVFGRVGIDMIAGPSEVVVVADASADPDWIAMDLFAQAEHDELAQSLLVTPDAGLVQRVRASIERLLPGMQRRRIIARALADCGALVRVPDLDEAARLVNRIAPEHLELMIASPRAFLERVRHAGAVFLGRYSAEVMGDYCAGPNHVLPTSGTARYSSPLGVYDFQKRTSVIECSAAGGARLAATAAVLADAESLTAHARSARLRLGKGGGE